MPKVENIILEQWMPWAWGWGGSIYIYMYVYIHIYMTRRSIDCRLLENAKQSRAVPGSISAVRVAEAGVQSLIFHTKHARVMAAFRELQGCEIQGVPGAWRYIRQHLRGWHRGIVCACGGLGHLMLSGRS